METLEKLRLALLQLKEYSDNDLIIIDGKELSIKAELEALSDLNN